MITVRASWSQEAKFYLLLLLRASHSTRHTSASISGNSGGGGRAHRNTASWRAADNLLLSSGFCLDICKSFWPQGPGHPWKWTRTAYRLDVEKMHLFRRAHLASHRGTPAAMCTVSNSLAIAVARGNSGHLRQLPGVAGGALMP